MGGSEQVYDMAPAGGNAVAAAFRPDEPVTHRPVGAVKRAIFKYLQPAMLLGILAFWSLAPDWVTGNAWVGASAGTVIMATIMALEWVNERHAHWRLTVREFLEGAFYIVCNRYVFGAVAAVILYDPLSAFVDRYGLSTELAKGLPLAVQVLMLIFMHEFVQYWFHRLLHNNGVLWEVHVPHHYITQMNTMNAAVGNWAEIIFLGLTLGIFFEMPKTAILCAGNIGGAVAYFAHSNIRFDPPRWYSFFFTTIEHHSLHHSLDYDETRCNYANELILLDRMFGTYREGEAVHVGQDNQRRLSIWQQTIWPFLPYMARARARWG
ncbi:sterol desaturase family protein [Sphingomonas sp. ID0503]|uniref:sterol desaturase family protein n=1 Tax=Sphingomonas sp. ID0503 TaxID=3399691 RepID=UPI003AFAF559